MATNAPRQTATVGSRGHASKRPTSSLTDVTMPGLSGFELAEALRRDKRTRAIPIIFISGETSAESQAPAHELGAPGSS